MISKNFDNKQTQESSQVWDFKCPCKDLKCFQVLILPDLGVEGVSSILAPEMGCCGHLEFGSSFGTAEEASSKSRGKLWEFINLIKM